MHEAGIAERILEVALARAAEAGASTITLVELEAGEASGVGEDAVAFHWAEAARGTAAEGAALLIRPVDDPAAFRLVAIEVGEDPPVASAAGVPAAQPSRAPGAPRGA